MALELEDIPQDEKLRLSAQYFLLTCSDELVQDKEVIRQDIMQTVQSKGILFLLLSSRQVLRG